MKHRTAVADVLARLDLGQRPLSVIAANFVNN